MRNKATPKLRHAINLLLLLLLAALSSSCILSNLIGPTKIRQGEVANYSVRYTVDGSASHSGTAYLATLVPTGWVVRSADYVAAVAGRSVTGSLKLVDEFPGTCKNLRNAPSRYQWIFFKSQAFSGVAPGNSGKATIAYLADSPVGNYEIEMIGGGVVDMGFDCGQPVTVDLLVEEAPSSLSVPTSKRDNPQQRNDTRPGSKQNVIASPVGPGNDNQLLNFLADNRWTGVAAIASILSLIIAIVAYARAQK